MIRWSWVPKNVVRIWIPEIDPVKPELREKCAINLDLNRHWSPQQCAFIASVPKQSKKLIPMDLNTENSSTNLNTRNWLSKTWTTRKMHYQPRPGLRFSGMFKHSLKCKPIQKLWFNGPGYCTLQSKPNYQELTQWNLNYEKRYHQPGP